MKLPLLFSHLLFVAPIVNAASEGWHVRHLQGGNGSIDEDRYGLIGSDDFPFDGPPGGTCISVKNNSAEKGNTLLLGECTYGWRFDDDGFVHSELDDNYCMQAGHNGVLRGSEKMRLYPCDKSKAEVQQFVFDGIRILPKYNQDYCLVWRGVNPSPNVDPIVLRPCEKVAERDNWSGDFPVGGPFAV